MFFVEKLLGSLVNPLTLALAFAVWAFFYRRRRRLLLCAAVGGMRPGDGEILPRRNAENTKKEG